MNKIPKEIYSYLSSIQSVRFEEPWIFISTSNGDYSCYLHPQNVSIYETLQEIGFISYQKPINNCMEPFQLFFIDSTKKCSSLKTLYDLYCKSSAEVMEDSHFLSTIYQKMDYKFQNTLQYYYGLQDQIEEMYFPRENYYHLLIHISSVYRLLHLGKFFLEEWFSMREDVYREVLTIRNLSIHNFSFGVLDVSSARRDLFVFELANYYQEHYSEEGIMNDIYDFIVQFSMTQNELFLFFSLISLVWKVDEENIDEISSFLLYVHQTCDFLSKKYEEYQEGKKEMLKEKEKNI